MSAIKQKQGSIIAISDFAYHHAGNQPDAEALVLGSRRITYAQLALEIDHCVMGLMSLGIKKGDRVATLCTPSPEFFILFLAAASIGAIWVGLNPKYTLDELSYVVGDAEPKVIFSRTEIEAKGASRDYASDLLALKEMYATIEHIVTLDHASDDFFDLSYPKFLQQGRSVGVEAVRKQQKAIVGTDSALIVYTSGTTGKPKGALLPHGGLISCSLKQNEIYACSSVRLINFLPINHIGCVGDISCWALVAGGTIFFMEHFDPLESMKMISEEKITVWGGIPTTFLMCLRLPDFDTFDLSSVEMILWGGAAAPKDLIVTLSKITPKLGNCYGQTETVGSITFVPPCTDVDLLSNTVGKPADGYDVKILNPNGALCAVGEIGEIVVKGDFIMKGYWRRPEETARVIGENGYLHTGDLGSVRDDGFIKLVGRTKEMFKSGGYNVYPREIEQALENHPAVEMAAVVAVDDPIYSEVGYAFILDPKQSVDATVLQAYCRERLANYKVPKKFIIEAELPMLPIGKIDKMALKKSIALQSSH